MESGGLIHVEKGSGREIAPRLNYSGIEPEMPF